MKNYFKRKLNGKVGLPPGSTIYSGEEKQNTIIHLYKYDEKTFDEKQVETIADIKFDSNLVNWIHISGFENHELILEIISLLDIHSLMAEDIFNMEHIPKFEEYDNSSLIILKNYFYKDNSIKANHCSIYLESNIVISFQEYPNEILDKKIERLRLAKGKTRSKKADYLFFVIIDSFVDTYFIFFEDVREKISGLEDKLLTNKKENCINEIYELNSMLNYVRKSIFPLKDALYYINEEGIDIIAKENLIFFRDIEDHMREIIQHYESFGGLIRGLIDLNENNVNSNTNETMKVLTIIASIFIPLTFIAGIYGMNFDYIPELREPNGYFFALGVMSVIALGLIIFMKYKKWF